MKTVQTIVEKTVQSHINFWGGLDAGITNEQLSIDLYYHAYEEIEKAKIQIEKYEQRLAEGCHYVKSGRIANHWTDIKDSQQETLRIQKLLQKQKDRLSEWSAFVA